MKIIISLLVGILIGSGSAIWAQHIKASSKIQIVDEFNGTRGSEAGLKVTDISTDRLSIQNCEDIILAISSKENPSMSLDIIAQGAVDPNKSFMMNQIIIRDKNGVHTTFIDSNADGIWDEK